MNAGDDDAEDELVGRAHVRRKSQLTLPSEVRQALHVEEGDEVEFHVRDDGEVVLRGMTSIPADQRWFWTAEWQDGERAASAEIAAGGLPVYDDAEAMFAALDQ